MSTAFQNQLEQYKTLDNRRSTRLTNFRNPEHVLDNLIKELEACIASLSPGNQDPDLVSESVLKFKQLDTMRKNSVITNFPMLEEYFKSNGY